MIKAIETQYKGYRFRSRLEARWAVFFDALGLKWEYEPEGFQFDDGTRYLPDFRIRGVDTNPDPFEFWFEVKSDLALVGKQEMGKMRRFAGGGRVLILLCGVPELKSYPGVSPIHSENIDFEGGDFEWSYWLWSFRRRPWRDAQTGGDEDQGYMSDGRYHRGGRGAPMDDLKAAVNAARSARFEYGQSGARA
jgi:hypothetical protein